MSDKDKIQEIIDKIRMLSSKGNLCLNCYPTGSEIHNKLKELEQELSKQPEADKINIKEPVPELKGTFPVVLYFGTEKDCDEFKNIVQDLKPNLVARKL
ncbi:MAG: hypothetical protein KAS30_01665 [Candidatus Diapherotrites archaeon]|nr:hypothetical protein [Candidatus Diapherotrites archaeon]